MNVICPKCARSMENPANLGTVICDCGTTIDVGVEQTIVAQPRKAKPPAPAEPMPARIGKFEILERVAAGGMGVIYRARQPELDRVVAVKVIKPELAEDAHFVERFFQEARALAKLNHPNVVQVHDAARDGRHVYIVMEFVEGRSLRGVLKDGKPALDDAVRFAIRLCNALEYAHGAGVVHRDIKPENVLVTMDGAVKLTDFGLAAIARGGEGARLTNDGAMMGTFNYMAPEQREDAKSVDHRADLYALGVVLYEMLTGRLPTGRFDPPSAFGAPPWLDPVVMKALEQLPERRFPSASAFKASLVTSESPTAPGVPPPPPPPRGAGVSWFLPVLLLLVLAPAVALVLWLLMARPGPPAPAPPAPLPVGPAPVPAPELALLVAASGAFRAQGIAGEFGSLEAFFEAVAKKGLSEASVHLDAAAGPERFNEILVAAGKSKVTPVLVPDAAGGFHRVRLRNGWAFRYGDLFIGYGKPNVTVRASDRAWICEFMNAAKDRSYVGAGVEVRTLTDAGPLLDLELRRTAAPSRGDVACYRVKPGLRVELDEGAWVRVVAADENAFILETSEGSERVTVPTGKEWMTNRVYVRVLKSDEHGPAIQIMNR